LKSRTADDHVSYKGAGTGKTIAQQILEGQKEEVCLKWMKGQCRYHESECPSGSHPELEKKDSFRRPGIPDVWRKW